MSGVDTTTYQAIGGKPMADKPKTDKRFVALKGKFSKQKDKSAKTEQYGKESSEKLAIKSRLEKEKGK